MRSGSTKDLLADVLIPGMLKTVENDSFTPVCIVFVCEMWMWELEKAAQNKPVNWKPTSEELDELKKQTKKIETIVLNFDTALNSTCVIYRKEGTDLNEDGEVTKNIHLVRWQAKEMELNEKDVKLTGRFTNLLKKYQNTNNPN